MANLKHIGQVANTGLKCIVVFREIYDENGNVTEPDNCLIVETERLPDMEHDDIVRIVESPSGQEAKEFFERMSFQNADQAVMLVEVKQKNRDLKEVVKEWKDNNPDKWKSWIPN